MGRKLQDIFVYSRNFASRKVFLHLPRKIEPIEGSKTSAFKPQTPGKYPKENILHKEHGETLKSRHLHLYGEETTRHIRLFEKLRIKKTVFLHLPRKMEPIEGSETSAFKPQTPGKYPKGNILHKEHGESLKSRHVSDP